MSQVSEPTPDLAPDAGDPACWLDRVCDACGAVIEGDPASHVCRPAATPGGRS
jgi:hypothetical protein